MRCEQEDFKNINSNIPRVLLPNFIQFCSLSVIKFSFCLVDETEIKECNYIEVYLTTMPDRLNIHRLLFRCDI
jgi:hypothetical protein